MPFRAAWPRIALLVPGKHDAEAAQFELVGFPDEAPDRRQALEDEILGCRMAKARVDDAGSVVGGKFVSALSAEICPVGVNAVGSLTDRCPNDMSYRAGMTNRCPADRHSGQLPMLAAWIWGHRCGSPNRAWAVPQ